MKTIELKLYDIMELKDEAFRKAVDDNRDINVDNDWWSDGVLEEWNVKLQEMGFINPKIYFSGFWSQGDGACFNADIDIDQFIKHFKLDKFTPLLSFAEKEELDLTASIEKNSYATHYSHERTRYAEVDFWVPEDIKDKAGDVEKLADELEKELESTRLEMCHNIYKDLQREYEDDTTEDAIVDTLQANEYTFLEDGTMYK